LTQVQITSKGGKVEIVSMRFMKLKQNNFTKGETAEIDLIRSMKLTQAPITKVETVETDSMRLMKLIQDKKLVKKEFKNLNSMR